jgi:hypothetical protein
MEKSLYSLPQGMNPFKSSDQTDEPTEFEIEGQPTEALIVIDVSEDGFSENLAETIDPKVMSSLAGDLVGEIDNDKGSRKDWEKAYTEGLKLLGLQYEERTEPWNGACGVFHPMITEAVVRFQSETITETFPAAGPVKTKIIGKETPEKKEAAVRVEEDMNYQLTEKMVEFRPEHERMLWSLPATGSAFKKVYYDPSLGRQTSIFCPAEDVILPYGISEMQTSHRITHEMRKTKNEIIKLQQAGFYIDVDIGEPTKDNSEIAKAKDKETGFSDLNDDRFTLYECHVDLDLEGYEDEVDGEPTGIALPYVVTIIKGTNTILAIRRNWEEDDELKSKRQHFVHYQYIPGFGAYGFGLFHLIGGFAKSATSIMRQLVDAGTLSNLPGGLKSRGLRIKGDYTPISPGEFRDVDVGSGTIRDNILPLPYKEPSQVLAALLDKIVDEGRRFAATADLKVSDMSAQAPVGTTLALLERQLKVMTAVQARVHYAFKQELRLIAEIIEDYTEEDYSYEPETGGPQAKKSDYGMVDIIPVSDPNAATMSQRVIQYQAVIQMSQMAPQIYNLPELHRGMLDVLGIKNAAKLVPIEEDMTVIDPVSENMAFLNGKPTKAFLMQDHDAHIAVHQTFMQDPMIAQVIGQNPAAQQMGAAIMAHISEHLGFSYRKKIEERLGVPMPIPNAKLDPEIEVQLSRLVAQASTQLLQMNKAAAAQQQAQQQAQDPLIQMQQAELQIKGQEVQIKAKKVDADIAIAQQRLQLDAQQKGGPDPRIAQQQATQQAQQAHQQQLSIQAQQSQAQQQAMQQAAALKAQQLQQAHQHKQQAHIQGLTHKQQAHQQKLAAQALAAQQKKELTNGK